MSEETPYLEERVVTIIRKYNPKYGDDRMCDCGHPYYRHFDTYEDMLSVGCKYCDCYPFVESGPYSPVPYGYFPSQRPL